MLSSTSESRATEELGKFVHDLDIGDMPAATVLEYERQILDALCTVIASLRISGGSIPLRAVTSAREGGDATIIGSSEKVPAPLAAFTNAQMSIALDLASNLLFSQGLPGTIVFAALGLLEERGRSGKAFIESVACGYEVSLRARLAMERADKTLSHLVLGASAAAAKALELDAGTSAHAIALGAAAAPITTINRFLASEDTGMVKYGLVGGMASNAVLSAMIAAQGYTGDLEILDDPVGGFFPGVGTSLADRSALTEDLSSVWHVHEGQYKRYPSGTHNQHALELARRLVDEHGISPGSIRRIRVGRALGMEPVFEKKTAGNYIEAQFTQPFALAALLVGVPPRDWPFALDNPDVQVLAERVELEVDPEAVREQRDESSEWGPWSAKTKVTIETDNGVFELRDAYPPVSDEELLDKFHHWADEFLGEERATRVADMVLDLESLEVVSILTAELDARAPVGR